MPERSDQLKLHDKSRPMFRVHAIFLLATCVFSVLATCSAAQSFEDARKAFLDGEYLKAAEIGEAAGTSDSYAMAARALGVYGNFLAPESERISVLERAIGLAELAVSADSTNAEAHFQSAHVVGRYAENIGKMKALREGIAGRIRDFLETAIRLDPTHAEAHVALGGWHAEIAAAGRIARWMYKGGLEEAIFHMERGLEIAPDSKVVLFEYGNRVADLDPDNGQARARELLSRAADLPIVGADKELLQEQILAALEKMGGR